MLPETDERTEEKSLIQNESWNLSGPSEDLFRTVTDHEQSSVHQPEVNSERTDGNVFKKKKKDNRKKRHFFLFLFFKT